MKMIYMLAENYWADDVRVKYGAFFNETDANAKAKELADAEALKEKGRVEVKNNKYSGNLEFWIFWKNGSSCITVVPIDVI